MRGTLLDFIVDAAAIGELSTEQLMDSAAQSAGADADRFYRFAVEKCRAAAALEPSNVRPLTDWCTVVIAWGRTKETRGRSNCFRRASREPNGQWNSNLEITVALRNGVQPSEPGLGDCLERRQSQTGTRRNRSSNRLWRLSPNQLAR